MKSQLGKVYKLWFVVLLLTIAPHFAHATDFTKGGDTLSVNLREGKFTLNGTTYGPYGVSSQNGGADTTWNVNQDI